MSTYQEELTKILKRTYRMIISSGSCLRIPPDSLSIDEAISAINSLNSSILSVYEPKGARLTAYSQAVAIEHARLRKVFGIDHPTSGKDTE